MKKYWNKKKYILSITLVYLLFLFLISTDVLADMLQAPTSIVVGVTDFNENLKKDCDLILDAAVADGYAPNQWKDFVAYKHLNGTPVTVSFETYTKNLSQ